MFQAQGYPFELSHEALIRATMEAIKVPPIPLRSFRVGGIHTWILAFELEPSSLTFSLKMDSNIYEVILAPQTDNKAKISKNKPKKKEPRSDKSSFPVHHVVGSSQLNMTGESAKVVSLEARVSRLETQQVQLAEKVDSRFDQVSLQLQQVLAAVTPAPNMPHGTSRPRPSEVTGETPPNKTSRQSN